MNYDPIKVTQAGDALHLSIAMVNTVWLALEHAETSQDVARAADTLLEAHRGLLKAQELIGLYQQPEERAAA